MPGFRGTGPMGKGPMTGRGRGYCMSYVDSDHVAGFAQSQRGMRRRRHLCWSENAGDQKLTNTAHVLKDTYQEDFISLQNQVMHLEGMIMDLKKTIQQTDKKKE